MSVQRVNGIGNTLKHYAASIKSATKPVEKNLPDESGVIEELRGLTQNNNCSRFPKQPKAGADFYMDAIV